MDANIVSRSSVIKQLHVNILVRDVFELPEDILSCIKDYLFYQADVSITVNLLRRVVLPFMRQISVRISDVREVHPRVNSAYVVREFVGEHTSTRVYGAKNHSIKQFCLQCGNYCTNIGGTQDIICTCTNPYSRERLTTEEDMYYEQDRIAQSNMYEEYDEEYHEEYDMYEYEDMIEEEYAEDERMEQMERMEGMIGCY